MTLYDELKGVASELLADPDFKQGVITLVTITPGAGPADEPGAPTETQTTLNGVASGVPYKFIMQNLAVQGDLMVTAAVIDTVNPKMVDFILIDGKRYKVISYMPTPPAGVTVVWKWIVRYGA